MTTQGDQLKDEGMQLALLPLEAMTWENQAVALVATFPVGYRFTSEHLIAKLGLPNGTPGQHRNNAVGATMRALKYLGLIEHTGMYIKSARPISHSAVIGVWVRI